jgi:hypothetical protein
VQKAKEARTVGILVGTLGAGNTYDCLSIYLLLHLLTIAGYLKVIERLKKIMKLAGKKVSSSILHL